MLGALIGIFTNLTALIGGLGWNLDYLSSWIFY